MELSSKRQREWLARIKRKDVRPEQFYFTRVCEDHFLSGSPSKLFDESSPDWAPSLLLGYDNDVSSGSGIGRYERAVGRESLKRLSSHEMHDDEQDEQDDEVVPAISTQTELTMGNLSKLEERATTLNKYTLC